MKKEEYAGTCNWGPHTGKLLCYEYCAHNDSTNVSNCSLCTRVRFLDEIGDIIEVMIRNNLNRPIDIGVLFEQTEGTYSRNDVRFSFWHGRDNGRFEVTDDWLICLNENI